MKKSPRQLKQPPPKDDFRIVNAMRQRRHQREANLRHQRIGELMDDIFSILILDAAHKGQEAGSRKEAM